MKIQVHPITYSRIHGPRLCQWATVVQRQLNRLAHWINHIENRPYADPPTGLGIAERRAWRAKGRDRRALIRRLLDQAEKLIQSEWFERRDRGIRPMLYSRTDLPDFDMDPRSFCETPEDKATYRIEFLAARTDEELLAWYNAILLEESRRNAATKLTQAIVSLLGLPLCKPANTPRAAMAVTMTPIQLGLVKASPAVLGSKARPAD